MPAKRTTTEARRLKAVRSSRASLPPRDDAMELDCPEHLSPEAKAWWCYYAPILAERGTSTLADAGGLQQLCETAGDIDRLRKALASYGGYTYEATSVTGERIVRAYPEVGQLNTASRMLRALLNDFGLTPAGRARVAEG